MGTDYAGWFDRINTAGLTWYGMYLESRQTATNQTAAVRTTPTGVTTSVSLPLLIVGAVVVLGAVYLYKKG